MKLGIKVIFIECDCKHFRESTILDGKFTYSAYFLDVVKVLGQIVNLINNTNNINNINNNMIIFY